METFDASSNERARLSRQLAKGNIGVAQGSSQTAFARLTLTTMTRSRLSRGLIPYLQVHSEARAHAVVIAGSAVEGRSPTSQTNQNTGRRKMGRVSR